MGNKKAAIEKAKEYLVLADQSHGMDHVRRVAEYSLEIAKSHPEVDIEMLEIAAWWHDVGRTKGDKGHQKRSAEMAYNELPGFGYDRQFARGAYEAIVNHSTHADEEPSNIEGMIVKDADKLEYLSPRRWEKCVTDSFYKYFDEAIADIPKIRNGILFLPESKKKYDKLLLELKNYAKSEKAADFQKYKDSVLSLEPIKWEV